MVILQVVLASSAWDAQFANLMISRKTGILLIIKDLIVKIGFKWLRLIILNTLVNHNRKKKRKE